MQSSIYRTNKQRNFQISYVKIEDDAFIKTNYIVQPCIKTGEGAIVGSNDLVLKDSKPWIINIVNP